jgi:hypothetical protein
MPLRDEEVPVFFVISRPWCSVGLHSLPPGYLRGCGGYPREPGETEEELKARSIAAALKERPPRSGCVILGEDREPVACTKCSGSASP